MKLVVATEHHYLEAPDGSIWAAGAYNEGYWKRYLNVFLRLTIIARVKKIDGEIPKNFFRIDSPQISFIKLPDYYGPFQYLTKYYQIRKILRNALCRDYAYYLQVPGTISNLMVGLLKDYPFGLDVMGDPYDVFSPGSNKNIFRWYFRSFFTSSLKKYCQRAVITSYVSIKALQKRYPPGKNTFSVGVSNVIIRPEQVVKSARKFKESNFRTLIYVGTLSQLYKAPEVLIKALKICRDLGYDYRLEIIGDGKYRNFLSDLTKKFGIEKSVKFVGQLNSFDQIIKHLDSSDLFVLPSRQEGVPRALLEAMARGLPAVSSNVGGIPEILPRSVLVVPGNANILADKIIEVASSAKKLSTNSAANLKTIKRFDIRILQKRKDDAMRKLAKKTEEYLSTVRKTEPKISVLMPVYNAEKYLAETINSVLNQSYLNFEFIIVNDCSTDSSLEIIRKYQKNDQRIKVVSLAKNIGVAGALNAGLKICSGKFVARVDADDPCKNDRFEKQLKYLKKHPRVFLVASNVTKINQSGKHLVQSLPRFFSACKSRKILERRNFIYHSSVFFRRDKKISYREKILHCEDYDLYLRLLSDNKRMVVLLQRLIKYRAVANSVTRKNNEKLVLFHWQACKFYKERKRTGSDSYNQFDPNEILKIDTKKIIDKRLFSYRIIFNFANNQFFQARKNCQKYFKHFGSFNKYYFYYLLTFFPDRTIVWLKSVRNFFSY
ncbi:MAG: glycosyltransferase [Candidatus Berkelbacteria bacterium]|nr:glycosyltransferase [Candidatus Berkelbacteria bacterium]